MKRFTTISGSIYEVNLAQNKCRRLLGLQDPTTSQGQDGEWRQCKLISPIEVGLPVVFVWETIMNSSDINLKSTMTSEVISINNVDEMIN